MGGAPFMLAGGLTRNSQLLVLETLNITYTLLILLYCRSSLALTPQRGSFANVPDLHCNKMDMKPMV
ncbi:unnamed protein product [Sphagnum jensenii]|uniref:Uncharacterized protein n=1 Tax=Sphagnum jensenii TaxID=128206 RepID=A0ABP1AZW7_9BRYO